ncbi:MAG: energy-coupling factor transporter transmembrane protein EcfT [Anaerolineales bacterium]|nr:energy-coupling factor transporter transmembrane protein EcfT [Anaerolineales bacterium]
MNSFTWIIWLITILAALSATRNPLHILIILLTLGVMSRLAKKDQKDTLVPFSIFPFFLILVFTASAFNALTSHFGSTIFFTIPGEIPLISGSVTLEAVIYGATNGFVLSGIFFSFTIFNQSLSVKTIIRMIPKAFYPLALIISIAINFLPAIKRRLEEIRQAQAIRGHQLHHIKDYISLFMPLLIDSLERSMLLAEAMTARGFIPHSQQQSSLKSRLIIFSGLLVFVSGWLIQLINGNNYALGISLAGVAIIIFWFWWISKNIPQSVYKREEWHVQDWVVSGIVLSALCLYFVPLPFTNLEILSYDPYPTALLPDFDAIIGCASFCFLAPAFYQKRTSR